MAPRENDNYMNEIDEIKKDLIKLNLLIEKIDMMTTKVSNVSEDISRLIIIHGQKLEFNDKALEGLISSINSAKQDMSRKDESIFDMLSRLEDKLNERRERLSESMKLQLEKIKHENDVHLTEMRKEKAKQLEEINKKLSFVEKFVWIATGGGAVVGFLLSFLTKFWK